MRGPSLLAFTTWLLASLLVGCVPRTTYRYTGFTPAARPIQWDGRGTHGGTLHLEGTASETDGRLLPQAAGLHRTALRVSTFSADGAILLEPVRGFEFGVRGSYSAYAWSHESTFGTMPLVSHPSLFGIGPELRLEVPFDRARMVSLGIAGNALHYDIPYAEYTRVPCGQTLPCEGTIWALTNTGSEPFFVLSGGLYPNVALGEGARYGSVFGIAAVTQGFMNDGFTNVRSGNGKIGQYAVPMFGGGYAFRHDWVGVSVALYMPLQDDPQHIDYGPGGWLTLSLSPRLWGGRRAIRPLEN